MGIHRRVSKSSPACVGGFCVLAGMEEPFFGFLGVSCMPVNYLDCGAATAAWLESCSICKPAKKQCPPHRNGKALDLTAMFSILIRKFGRALTWSVGLDQEERGRIRAAERLCKN